MEIQGKRVDESRGVMTRLMNLPDANPVGNVHGGVIMNLIDSAAGVVAVRHCRTNVVTASIDRLDLLRPIFIGDLVTFKASLNMVGKTSMEVGVRVDAENLRTGEVRKVAAAYLTYVALGLDGRPTQVPPLILETDEDRRRNNEAKARREARLQLKAKSKPNS
jgi:acyl-CoA hydrolase